MIKKLIIIMCTVQLSHAITLPNLPTSPKKAETAAMNTLKAYQDAKGLAANIARTQAFGTLQALADSVFAQEAIQAFEELQKEKGIAASGILKPKPNPATISTPTPGATLPLSTLAEALQSLAATTPAHEGTSSPTKPLPKPTLDQSALLAAIQAGKKLKPTEQVKYTPPPDPKAKHLAAIQGGIKLKQITPPAPKPIVTKEAKPADEATEALKKQLADPIAAAAKHKPITPPPSDDEDDDEDKWK